MGGEWTETTLGNVLAFQRGHDLPEDARVAGSVPVIGSAGFTGWHNEARATGPGLTIGRSGASAGVISFVPKDYWPHNTCLYVTDFADNDPRFCYYWLSSLNIPRFNVGSAQPSLNRNHLYRLPVRIPKPCEQRAIAETLSSLDDKIDLNRRMMRTFEDIARTLFQSWFVDFDPVRSTAVGHDNGLPKSLATLFPVAFTQNDLPEGWMRQPLEQLVSIVRATVQPRNLPTTTPYIGLEHIPRKRITLEAIGVASDVDSQKIAFEAGDILFGKLRSYFHKVAIAPVNGICSSDILVMRCKDESFRSFVSLAVSSETFVERSSAAATGTRMPRADWGQMSCYELAIPTGAVLQQFNDITNPIFARLDKLRTQNASLAALRDTLLPKLISGELRVRNAGQLVAGT